MTLNFCLPHFSPRIQCNKVCADGFEVSNLISADPVKRKCGFRAEYFIKPPVHVTITFPFNVELCKIDIDVSASLQNSSRLDIYTCTTSNKDMTWNGVSTPSSPLADQTFSDGDIFTLVGKGTLKNQSKVSFRHKAFKSRAPFHEFTEHSAVADGTFVQDLWNKGQFSLTNINHLRICISYVSGGSLPCLRRVDIWGQPSRSCPRAVIESAFKVYQKYKTEQSVPLVTQKNVAVTQSNQTQRDNLQPNVNGSSVAHGNVPEEFLDPITSEIMALPMLLPCGKVIDQSTLDKYNQCEATWGRLPNDPFTNVPFSRNSKPVPHSTLKARLDYFLLHTTIPDRAIVGRTHVGFVASSTVKRKSDSPQGIITNPTSEGLNAGISRNSAAMLDCGEKRFKTETERTQDPAQDMGAVSHEQRLSQSLDSALTSALNTLPSFTAQQRQDQQQPAAGSISDCAQEWIPASSDKACISCRKSFSAYSQNMVVYRLLCGHLICRVCLSETQKSSTPSCLKCNCAICTSDVVRVHL
ncbi:RING finger protein 37 isoform X2 [Stegostoma tigrinum]|uniref:RING finger protein 37 isoform X2 n=1 Tax=Stegostoma tigrinum TaxID=3053191 RepID=UPI00202AED9F|nr:RING finger protein 37 isoform X2 [Stegostoma tigrinum]